MQNKIEKQKMQKDTAQEAEIFHSNEEQALSPEGLLRWQDKSILIIGKPGVGKTTVVQEMLRLWAEKETDR